MDDPIALPVPPLSDERVLLQDPARYLLTTPSGVGYNPINGQLTLTSERLVFKPDRADGMQGMVLSAAGASVVTFPIRRIAECSEQRLKVQWGRPQVLKLHFDSGGREYFVIYPNSTRPAGTWVAALKQAQASASELVYDRMPALSPGFEQPPSRGVQRLLVYWTIAVVSMCMTCAVATLVVNGLGG
jgi:hypothetical protein